MWESYRQRRSQSRVGATELELHYDASAMNLTAIRDHVEAVSRFRTAGVTAAVHNIKLTSESAREIIAAAERALSWHFVLQEPMLPNGKRAQQLSLSSVIAMFPNAQSSAETVMQK